LIAVLASTLYLSGYGLRVAAESATISRMRSSRYLHLALLVISHFFLGTFVAVWVTYQFEQSRWLASLNQEQGRELLNVRETLLATQGPVRSTPQSLVRDVARLQSMRGYAGSAARPILDLRIASDRALLARLYADANDTAQSRREAEAARSLLRQLGWRDSSDAAVDNLAERRLQRLASKDVR